MIVLQKEKPRIQKFVSIGLAGLSGASSLYALYLGIVFETYRITRFSSLSQYDSYIWIHQSYPSLILLSLQIAGVFALGSVASTEKVSSRLWNYRKWFLRIYEIALFGTFGLFAFLISIDLGLPCMSNQSMLGAIADGLTFNPLQREINSACYSIAPKLGLVNQWNAGAGLGALAEEFVAIFLTMFLIWRVIKTRKLTKGISQSFGTAVGIVFGFELILHLLAPTQLVCEPNCIQVSTWGMTATQDLYMKGYAWITNALVFESSAILLSIYLFLSRVRL